MARRRTKRSAEPETALVDDFNSIVKRAGGDPEELSGKLVREMMHTSVKLISDEADTGELKLISRSLKELRYALKVFRAFRQIPKVTIFGSARTPEGHADYQAALAFSKAMAAVNWMVITGAGGGIMQAGHGGAGREASFGVSIRLPFECNANEFIAGDSKLMTFRYFFTRKLIFVSQAQAVALFPGGFGTLDEAFEVLTLVQTGKAPIIPIILMDSPTSSYWRQWDRYVRDQILASGFISPEDLNLYHLTDSVDDAVLHIRNFYRNYHSQRFVRDHLVLRIRQALTEDQLAAINDEFNDLVDRGQIEQGEAMVEETDHLDLPRLKFVFRRGRYGRLRLLIDRINALGPAELPVVEPCVSPENVDDGDGIARSGE